MSVQPHYEPVCKDRAGVIDLLIEPRAKDLGGFQVRRVLPSSARLMVGPFIFFDHIGPAQFEPGKGVDVRPHPHIGLATVTYLFEGEILHRDSLRHVQAIRPGAVNWMTAGHGIVHSERTPPELRENGSRLHGIQSWIALPLEAEETDPSFFHHPVEMLPTVERPGLKMRLIAGTAFDDRSPVATVSAMFYIDADLAGGATLDVPQEHEERAVYVVDGEIALGGDTVQAGKMFVLQPGTKITVYARQPTKLMLLGGAHLEGERHIWWNFVSSSRERIEQAKRDWKEGRFDKIPGETEFIPLPEE
jgi:Pirin-related protein